tara:strand:- start:857 stop:1528 length:672 start_codon:yes stop_codon:yes gene_type:complete
MFPRLPREYCQLISTLCLIVGVWLMAQSQTTMVLGVAFVGFSVWVLMISESILLAKVQNEMQAALDGLSRKKEREVEEILSYLRQSKIVSGQNPLDNLESATNFMMALGHPSFLLGPSFGIVRANEKFTDCLGLQPGSLDGRPAHEINDSVVMSAIGNLVNQPEHKDTPNLSLRYAYKHKDGSNIFGSLHVVKMIDGCFFMVFHPDKAQIVSQEELEDMLRID